MKPSLFVSLRRRTPKKDPKFRRRQTGWIYRLKQRALIFGMLGIVGFAIFWLQSWAKSSNAETTQTQLEELATEKVLQRENLSTRDLIYKASTMQLDPDAPLPVIMEYIKNRMEIADELLAQPDDEVAQKEGTLYRIEALQNLSKLNRTHSMGYSTVDKQLYELCSANLSHRDAEVSKIAAAAIMISSLDEFSFEPTSANLTNALSKCDQVASQLGEDIEIARAIFTYAKMKKRSEVTVDDSVEFFNVVIRHYLKSKNDDVKKYALRSFNEILFGDESAEKKFAGLLIAGIKDRFRQKRRSVEKELNNRIRYAMRSELFDVSALNQIANLLEVYPSVDRVDMAQQIIEEVEDFYLTIEDPDLKSVAIKQLENFQTRIDQMGQTMDFNGLLPLQNATDDWLADRLTLAIYWSADDSRSAQLLRALKNLSFHRVAQCVVICIDPELEFQQQALKLAKEMDGFTFVAPRSFDGDDSFLAKMPVPGVPYLVLLDDQHQVISLNPDLRSLGKKLQDMSSKN